MYFSDHIWLSAASMPPNYADNREFTVLRLRSIMCPYQELTKFVIWQTT